MPPRKRLRASQPASPAPASQAKTPTPAAEESSPAEQQITNDPWTDEEEIALFKALMRCKPTGIHKHFHLLAVHQDLLNGGHIHPRNEHTKPAGIWQKLESLYDLGVLDEREDARQLEKVRVPGAYRGGDVEESSSSGRDEDIYSEAANKIENDDFSLPGGDFAQQKWMRRLATEKQRRDESPPLLPELNMADEPPVRFTPSFSIEPSEVATPTTSRRSRGRAGMTSTKAAAATSTRRSTRQAESGADDEDDEGEDEGEVDAQDESSDSEEEEEDQSEQSTPARRGKRNTKDDRSRAADPKSKTRSRGRTR